MILGHPFSRHDIQTSDPVPQADGLAVLSRQGFRSTVATRVFHTGEIVFPVAGESTARPTRYTIQVAADRHVLTTCARFVNHNCGPNCRFDDAAMVFRALQTIACGEEITFNYNTTEYDLACPFRCHCGLPNCLGYVRGYKYLSPPDRERLASLIPDHLRFMCGGRQ